MAHRIHVFAIGGHHKSAPVLKLRGQGLGTEGFALGIVAEVDAGVVDHGGDF
jgi:hypothetical protein